MILQKIEKINSTMAEEALRVIAVAYSIIPKLPDNIDSINV